MPIRVAMCLVLLAGCGGRTTTDHIRNAESITLVSVHPDVNADTGHRKLNGIHPVIEERVVTDEATRLRLADALDQSLRSPGAVTKKCFWPRHAIEVGDRFFIICFECSTIRFDGRDSAPIGNEAESVFDEVWNEYELPVERSAF